jgi:hypothetical protein
MRSFKLFGGGCVAALKRIKEGGYCMLKKTDGDLHGGSEGKSGTGR